MSALSLEEVSPPPARRAAEPRASFVRQVGLGTGLGWAVVIGTGLSTEYLVQPFVWRNWPIDAVLLGWTELLRDRILVAACVALAIVAATRVVAGAAPLRIAAVALAVVVGSVVGEIALRAVDASASRSPGAEANRILQSTLLAWCACGIWALWHRAERLEASARGTLLAASQADAVLAEARLQALRLQIEPHFLFNTLATIARFHESGSREALRLLDHLEHYLQAAVPTRAMETTVGEELALVESYLAIVAVRMSGRLEWRVAADLDARRCRCPALAIATLVENAVKHGMMKRPEGGTIEVLARRDGSRAEIVVADTGVGMLAAAAPSAGSGVGLTNTRARLSALYGNRGELQLDANIPHGVRATMRWPADPA